MDSGEQAFVLYHGERWSFPGELLEHLGVESGQTVNHWLLLEVMKANLLYLKKLHENQS